MIRTLTPIAAYASLHEQLGAPMAGTPDVRATWYAYFMRRTCATYCPIPRGKLIRIASELLAGIVTDPSTMREEIESAIDGLFESGDLIEISRFRSADEHYTGDWLFLAPPSFVQRESGRLYICGIAADDAPILPISLRDAVKSVGAYRYLPTSNDETIRLLQSVGLRKIPEPLWRADPKRQSPHQFLEQASRRLAAAPPAGTMDGLRLFRKNEAEHIRYKDRWVSPQSESGCFVCRRPGGYGAENWCYAELDHGRAVRFVDLPWAGEKLRGCDVGWQMQLAIDSVNSHPATYRAEYFDNNVVVRFSFPIPLWAQRRFQAISEHLNTSPFERNFSVAEWPTEQRIIENDLWFVSE